MTGQGVTLSPVYGGTEFGGPTYMARRPGGESDWEWMSLDARTSVRWESQGDGTYECQFLVRLLSSFNMTYVKLCHPDN